MRQILFSIFSSIFLLHSAVTCSQEDSLIARGFRFGTDLSKIAIPFFTPEIRGLEFLADIQVSEKLFLAGEYGINTAKLTAGNYNFNYNLNGTFLRLGFDKNILKDKKGAENDIVFVGARYSVARLKHKADDIYIIDGHWEDLTGAETNEYKLSAQWLEILVGIKTELFKNLFLGWSMRGMVKIKMTEDNIMKPYIIPGYGRGEKKSAFGFNYSLYYRFPYKLKAKERKTKDKT